MRQALITLLLVLGLAGCAVLVFSRPWAPKQNENCLVFVPSRHVAVSTSTPTQFPPAKPTENVTSVTYGEVFQTLPVDPKHPPTVRVAAIQMASELGRITSNRDRMSVLANQAASLGANFVVFPECALQGYMDVSGNRTWPLRKMRAAVSTFRWSRRPCRDRSRGISRRSLGCGRSISLCR